MIVNPTVNINTILASFEKQADYWIINGSITLGKTNLNVKDTKICVTNLENDLLLLPSNVLLCEQIKKIVCKSTADCNKTNAQILKAEKLVFEL